MYFSPPIKEEDFFKYYLNLTKEELLEVAHKPNQMISMCKFAGVRLPSDQCTKLMTDGGYVKTWTPRFGVCYTYNAFPLDGKKVKMSMSYGSGISSGLTLILDTDGEAYMANLRTERDGVLLAIHHNRQLGNLESNAIPLSTNTETSIGLSKTTFKRLTSPYKSNCTDKFPPGTPAPAGILPTYSLQACIGACMARLIFLTCGCFEAKGGSVSGTIHYLFTPKGQTFCTRKDKRCINKVYLGSSLPNFSDPVCQGCQHSCTEDQYEVNH